MPKENYGANFRLLFSVPKDTGTVYNYLAEGAEKEGQSHEYLDKDKLVVFSVRKFQGGAEHYFRTKINLVNPAKHSTRREVGPIRLHFEIPLYNTSGVRVRYLKIAPSGGSGSQKPSRWVRTVTQAASYVVRC